MTQLRGAARRLAVNNSVRLDYVGRVTRWDTSQTTGSPVSLRSRGADSSRYSGRWPPERHGLALLFGAHAPIRVCTEFIAVPFPSVAPFVPLESTTGQPFRKAKFPGVKLVHFLCVFTFFSYRCTLRIRARRALNKVRRLLIVVTATSIMRITGNKVFTYPSP